MRCYQVVEWGAPLVPREVPTPSPVGTEVLLRVITAGICHSDLHIHDGFFDLGEGRRAELAKLGASLPLTLGHEIAGVAEARGPEAEGIEVGAAVIAYPWIGCRHCPTCLNERESWCPTPKFLGARVDGGYADHVLVPHPRYLVPYDGIPSELAPTYACAVLTAYGALKKVAPALREDDHFVLIGAGGVGLSGLQLAPGLTPARLIMADVDPDKRATAAASGAMATIDNTAPDAVQQVQDLTSGGARAAIDFVGAPATARFGVEILRKGGHLVVVGLYGGALSLPLPMLAQRSLVLQGSYVGTLEEMREVVALGRGGRVPPIPVDVRPLDSAPEALADLRAGRVRGRVILKPT